MVCRVVLGMVEVLDGECGGRIVPTTGFDSCMAQRQYIRRKQARQVHNEFIVYEDQACYPEFVITVEIE